MGRDRLNIKRDGTIILQEKGQIRTYSSIDEASGEDVDRICRSIESLATEMISNKLSAEEFEGVVPTEWSGLYDHFIEELDRRGIKTEFERRYGKNRFTIELTKWTLNKDEIARMYPWNKKIFVDILSKERGVQASTFEDLFPVRILRISLGDFSVHFPQPEMSKGMIKEFDKVYKDLENRVRQSDQVITASRSDDVYRWKGKEYSSIDDIPNAEGREYFRNMAKERGFPIVSNGPTVCIACGQRGSIKKTFTGKWKCLMCGHKWTT